MAALRLASGGKQTGTVGTSTGTSVTQAITEIDITKSILLVSYQGGASNPSNSSVRWYFSSLSGNLSDQITFQWDSTTSVNLDFRWTVLTFDSGILVQHYSPAVTADGQTQTLGTSVDTGTSFVLPMGVQKSGSSFSQDDAVRYTLSSTQVTMHLEEASPSGLSVSFAAIDIDDCVVDVITSAKTSSTEVTYNESAGSSFTDSKTFFVGAMEYTGGSNPDAMLWNAYTADAGSGLVRVERNTGTSMSFTWTIFVIEFTEGSGGPLVTKDSFSISSGTDDGTDDFSPAVADVDLSATWRSGLTNGWQHPVTTYNTWSNGWNNVFGRMNFVDTNTVNFDRDSGASSGVLIYYTVLEFPEASGSDVPLTATFEGVGSATVVTAVDQPRSFLLEGSGQASAIFQVDVQLSPTFEGVGAATIDEDVDVPLTALFEGSGTLSLTTGIEEEVDCYDQSNDDSAFSIGPGAAPSDVGQSFEGNGGYLTRVRVRLQRVTSPTGDITAALYAHSGTFGTSSVPTGSALATSTNSHAASGVGTSAGDFDFYFDGTTQLASGTHYVIVIGSASWGGSGVILVRADASSPTAPGNASDNDSGWTAYAGEDLIFCIWATSPEEVDLAPLFEGSGALAVTFQVDVPLSATLEGVGAMTLDADVDVGLSILAEGSGSAAIDTDVDVPLELLFAGVGEAVVAFEEDAESAVEVTIAEIETILVIDPMTLEEYMSLLDVWNVALARLGISPVTSAPTSDGSDSGEILSGSWPLFKEKFLRESTWDGAKKTAVLSTFKEADGTTAVEPVDRWSFAYSLPSDHIRSIRLNGRKNEPGHKDRSGVGLWEEEVVTNAAGTRARCLLCEDSPANLEYIFLVPDSEITLCPSDMRWAMALSLAVHVAPFFGKTASEVATLESFADQARRGAKKTDDQTGTRLTHIDTTLEQSFW